MEDGELALRQTAEKVQKRKSPTSHAHSSEEAETSGLRRPILDRLFPCQPLLAVAPRGVLHECRFRSPFGRRTAPAMLVHACESTRGRD